MEEMTRGDFFSELPNVQVKITIEESGNNALDWDERQKNAPIPPKSQRSSSRPYIGYDRSLIFLRALGRSHSFFVLQKNNWTQFKKERCSHRWC